MHYPTLCITSKKSKSFPGPLAHRAAPISVSVALGHASANAVKATAGAGPLERQTRRQWVPFLKSLV